MVDYMTDKPDQDPIRSRQKSRALITAIALGAFAILLFFITIAKMTIAQ
jgi:hypothetical protein